ncbi:hypothetical protein FA95DRAFT_1561123 [Auriscalpium vulgare]|uniref:Uncharacterized protein n=1 Tax=Auriscalpium vulgare TaxID=40419 RepID=A0ACB8RNG0_9AGAM|nr:hypothetical protein FA95DRAFT_1561123 [Auriscalpium vulgare]
MNIDNYDLILGTPFMYQHQVTLGLNPATLVVQSNEALPIKGEQVTKLASRATDILENHRCHRYVP